MLDNFIYRKNTTDENVIKEILVKKAYGKKKIDFKIENDDVWLDGGSHIGVFGLYAAQHGAKKVYCYEPETENYKILQENIIRYNASIGKAKKFEQANFAIMSGQIAKQQSQLAQIRTVSEVGGTLLTMYNS